jgi:hypothetical protein
MLWPADHAPLHTRSRVKRARRLERRVMKTRPSGLVEPVPSTPRIRIGRPLCTALLHSHSTSTRPHRGSNLKCRREVFGLTGILLPPHDASKSVRAEAAIGEITWPRLMIRMFQKCIETRSISTDTIWTNLESSLSYHCRQPFDFLESSSSSLFDAASWTK